MPPFEFLVVSNSEIRADCVRRIYKLYLYGDRREAAGAMA
jgi:hypothetical protein